MEKMDHGTRGSLLDRDYPGHMPPSLPLIPRLETVPDGDDCGCNSGHNNGTVSPDTNGCGCDHTPTVPPANGGCGCVGHEGCGDGSWGLNGYPLAMVYAPCQTFCALYDPTTALKRGTAFSTLDLPLGSTDCGFTADTCSGRRERR